MPKSQIPNLVSPIYVNQLNHMEGYKALFLDWKDINVTSTQKNHNDILTIKAPKFYTEIVSKITPHECRYCYSSKDIDIFRKTYFGLSYFYYETKYRWLHRATDDNIINTNLIESYYEMIEKQYDPLRQPIILGNCVKNIDTVGFLQGGSGYLYSRRAVELMLPMYEDIIFKCVKSEDICHNEFIKRLNMTMVNVTSPHFIGHPFPNDDILRIKNNNFENLRKCPNPIKPYNPWICRIASAPLNKVVFLHHHANGVNYSIEICKKIFNIKDDKIHFYFPDYKFPRLCRID